MSNNTFKVAGVSKGKNGYKVRFANDMTRVKILAKTDSDIQLLDLPNEMTKSALVAHLKTTDLYANADYRAAIDAADEKYNGVVTTKSAKIKPSLEAIASRAKTTDAVAE